MTDPDTCPCGRTIADDYADGKRDRPELCIVCEVSEVCRELEPERHRDHMHAGTMAKYGDYQVFYCYTCSTHYRAAQGTQPGCPAPWG